MLEAMNKLADPVSELVLVGRIDTQKLEHEVMLYVNAHRLGQRVKLEGHKPYERLHKYLKDATVGLIAFEDLPHTHIIIPTKLFEYMAFGLPVVASDLPTIRPFVEGTNCGILVPPSDVLGLAAAIEHIFAHPAQAQQLGENGRRAVLDHYNWEAEERKLLSLYEDLLN
jgi:glycosyltransferase involved in cell wall biosynthesis